MALLPTDVISHYVRTRGLWQGLRQWSKRAYLRRTTSHDGTNIFDSDWDVLVILDACRPDLFREVSGEYDWIADVGERSSVGTATMHWMEQTFEEVADDTLEDTVYVCGNPFSGHLLDGDRFESLEEVWRWGWDDEVGTVPPRPVTDTAISLARERDPERLLVHYMQPHAPFIGSANSPKLSLDTNSPKLSLDNFTGSGSRLLDDWELIETGERTEAAVWEDYKDNLRVALDDVSVLRENVEAENFVVTSDHGNAVGEQELYGHPGGVSIPALYEVPWYATDASDTRTHQPSVYEADVDEEDIESKLSALGYV